MDSNGIYSQLKESDSIRILELTRTHRGSSPFCGKLITTRLSKQPDYVALSYVWGEPSVDDPILLLDEQPLQIRASLWQFLEELMAKADTVRLWVDQICINQENVIEREQQVQLMSKIYKYARLVKGWLGGHDNDSHLAFDFFIFLGHSSCSHGQRCDSEWQRATDALMEAGHLHSLDDLFNPYRSPYQAAASLVQRPWFRRLWIVQEIALASNLELCCGNSSIPSDIFFQAIQMLSSIITDPPMHRLLRPYRNAFKLRQLRANVSAGQKISLPHLAQTFCAWDCKKNHDRLIAFFGLLSKESPAWFRPTYRISASKLYTEFAKDHIRQSGGLSILHFAGCGDSNTHKLFKFEDRIVLQANPPADDIPSWVPDWRLRSRPLTISPDLENTSTGFSATESEPEFNFRLDSLQVCARKMDTIKSCETPYYESPGERFKVTENGTFNHWFGRAKNSLKDTNIESMLASTLVMDGKVAVTERQRIGVNSTSVPSLFQHWAKRNLNEYEGPCGKDCEGGIEDSTHYGYIAEEICRNRTFFITEKGRLGLGSVHVSPGASIYLIHGLKTPFVIHHNHGTQVLCGECYVYGLMDGKIQRSDQDSFLYLE